MTFKNGTIVYADKILSYGDNSSYTGVAKFNFTFENITFKLANGSESASAIASGNAGNDPVSALKAEFEPQGIKVYPISAVSGKGLKELLYEVNNMLEAIDEEPTVFAQEFFLEDATTAYNHLPFTVEYDEIEDEYVIEGPRIEKMLGYTNLESEKGFTFFQNFLKDSGILEQLEELGIEEGDTVRMYGLSFDYYK